MHFIIRRRGEKVAIKNTMITFDPLSPNFLVDLVSLGQKRGWHYVMSKYFESDDRDYFKKLNEIDAKYLEESGKNMVRALFNKMYFEVPAYKDFLKKNVKGDMNIDDFHWDDLPIINKDNYLRQYNKEDLVWNSNSNSIHTFSVSSGTSGKPYFWPRGAVQEVELSLVLGNMLRYMDIGDDPTLVINTFSMGMYIAGLVVSNGISRNAEKGMKLEMFTPGISFDDFFSIINNINGKYKKIIISGYPPLVKDFIVESVNQGFNWHDRNIRFIFAAESFNEEWREHIHNLVGTKLDYNTSLNIYGTADAGILGHETPLSNFIRKKASQNPQLLKQLFNDTRLPSLVQYYPNLKYFENYKGELIFSSVSGFPLLRYNIQDNGMVISYNSMLGILLSFNIDAEKEMNELGFQFAKLPFVYLFGRMDLTASYYGLNVYPEHIKVGLEKNKEIMNICSGKFNMEVNQDNNFDQHLIIKVELNNKLMPTDELRIKISESIIEALRVNNKEYNKLLESLGDKVKLRIELIKYGSDPNFRIGIKHKWNK